MSRTGRAAPPAAEGGGSDGGGLSYEQVEHELKTPLTSIRSLSEILLDSLDLSEEQRRRFLEVLHAENLRLAAVVERLLGHPAVRSVLG